MGGASQTIAIYFYDTYTDPVLNTNVTGTVTGADVRKTAFIANGQSYVVPISTFFEFYKEVKGFTFHDKKTGKQIFKYEMYWKRLSSLQCFERFDTRQIKKTIN